MEFLHASIALLASMVLVLSGMVAWLYYQQTRIFQNMNNIVMIIGELTRPVQIGSAHIEPVNEVSINTDGVIAVSPSYTEEQENEDDRASVEVEQEKPADIVDSAPAQLDVDNLESKSKKELQELLTKRGIPFGKNDNKSSLINLLKATA